MKLSEFKIGETDANREELENAFEKVESPALVLQERKMRKWNLELI